MLSPPELAADAPTDAALAAFALADAAPATTPVVAVVLGGALAHVLLAGAVADVLFAVALPFEL